MIAQRQIAMKSLVVSYMRNFKSHLNRITEMRQKSRSKSSVSENEPQCVGGAAHFAYHEVLEDINVVMTNDLFSDLSLRWWWRIHFIWKQKSVSVLSPLPRKKKNRTLKQNFRVAFSFSLDDVSPQILFIERRARDLFRKINQWEVSPNPQIFCRSPYLLSEQRFFN